MGELSAQERKQLRLARFGGGGANAQMAGGLLQGGAATTIEALELIEE